MKTRKRSFPLLLSLLILLPDICIGQNKFGFAVGLSGELPSIVSGRGDDLRKFTQWPGTGWQFGICANRKKVFIKTGIISQNIHALWIPKSDKSEYFSKIANVTQYHIPFLLGWNAVYKPSYQLGLAFMVGVVNWQTGLYHVYFQDGRVISGPSEVPYRGVWGLNAAYSHQIKNKWWLQFSANYKKIEQYRTHKYWVETDYFQVSNWYLGLSLGIEYKF